MHGEGAISRNIRRSSSSYLPFVASNILMDYGLMSHQAR